MRSLWIRCSFKLTVACAIVFALLIQMMSSGVASRSFALMEAGRSQHGLYDGATPVCLGNGNGECFPGSVIPRTIQIRIPAEWHPKFLPSNSPVLSGTSRKPELPPPIQELGPSSVRADLPFRRNWILLGLDAQLEMEEVVKKVIVILAAMVVGLGLGACSSNYPPTPSPSSVQMGARGPDSPPADPAAGRASGD